MQSLRSRQLNPSDDLYWKSRGYQERPHNWRNLAGLNVDTWQRNNLRSRQLNPCDHLYWKCRGFDERPDDWQERSYGDDDEEEEEECDEAEEEEEEEEYDEEEESDSYSNSENESDEDDDGYEYNEHEIRSIQMNPNNIEYWKLRGWAYRPDDWRERVYGC